MVRTGQDHVERFDFRPPRRQIGLEVMTWTGLEISGPLRRPHRTSFHTVLLVDAGRLTFQLDFVSQECGPGSVLWVRPGQVQQIADAERFRARALLFVDEFPAPSDALVPLLRGPRPPSFWALAEPQHVHFAAACDRLGHAVDHADEPLQRPLARHALTALLLTLGTLNDHPSPASSSEDVSARLHDEIERSHRTTRRAEDYAQRLGYSLKTLNRAAQAASGLTAKQLIDARVILEARRLLVHTDVSAETVAHELGFTQPTNFAKFFTRHTGETPGTFRRRSRGT